MDVGLLIYLVSVVGAVLNTLATTAIVSGCVLGIFTIVVVIMVGEEGDIKKAKAFVKPALAFGLVFLFSTFFYVLIPDGKTIAAMVIVPKVVENQQIQDMSQDGLNILQGLTREWAKELSPPTNTLKEVSK